jgi:hypothetical protein
MREIWKELDEKSPVDYVVARLEGKRFRAHRAEVIYWRGSAGIYIYPAEEGSAPLQFTGPEPEISSLISRMKIGLEVEKAVQRAEVTPEGESVSKGAAADKSTAIARKLIEIAGIGYDEGMHSGNFLLDILDNPDAFHGDGLAEFIVREIQSVTEDDTDECDALSDAIRAMEAASEQINRTIVALENAPIPEE